MNQSEYDKLLVSDFYHYESDDNGEIMIKLNVPQKATG
jgi:hypothetical protein